MCKVIGHTQIKLSLKHTHTHNTAIIRGRNPNPGNRKQNRICILLSTQLVQIWQVWVCIQVTTSGRHRSAPAAANTGGWGAFLKI